jgi:hypothetical protein
MDENETEVEEDDEEEVDIGDCAMCSDTDVEMGFWLS